PGRGEEDPWLAEQQRLLLGLVPDEQHRDVGAEDPRPARLALGIRPDEPLAVHPEVEAVAVDLLHAGQGQGEAAHVVLGCHRAPSPAFAAAPGDSPASLRAWPAPAR